MEELLPKKGLIARVFDALVLLVESRLPAPDLDSIRHRFARIHSRPRDGERWIDQSADLRGLLRAAERLSPRRSGWARRGGGAAGRARRRSRRRVVQRSATVRGSSSQIGRSSEASSPPRARADRAAGHTVPREALFEARVARRSRTTRVAHDSASRVAMTNLRSSGSAAPPRPRGGFLLDPGSPSLRVIREARVLRCSARPALSTARSSSLIPGTR